MSTKKIVLQNWWVDPMLVNNTIIIPVRIRQKIREFYRIGNQEAIDHILPEAEVIWLLRSRAWGNALGLWFYKSPASRGHGWFDALLNEFFDHRRRELCWCVAEALLRVPDKPLHKKSLFAKISKGEWTPHLAKWLHYSLNALLGIIINWQHG